MKFIQTKKGLLNMHFDDDSEPSAENNINQLDGQRHSACEDRPRINWEIEKVFALSRLSHN